MWYNGRVKRKKRGLCMNIVICEDNKNDLNLLYTCIERFFREISCPVKIITYENGDSLLKEIDVLKRMDVKIVFMDIYMPGSSGIDVAGKIRETDSEIVIILTTRSLDHGLDAYSVYAFQYFVKPVCYPKVKEVLGKCNALFAESILYIEVMSSRLLVKVIIRDILYIEIFDHTCLIHTAASTIKSYNSLDEIEKMLGAVNGGSSFLRTHRSFIVNMRHINDIAENDFLLVNGAAVPIRRNGRMAIKQAYMDYLFAQTRGC